MNITNTNSPTHPRNIHSLTVTSQPLNADRGTLPQDQDSRHNPPMFSVIEKTFVRRRWSVEFCGEAYLENRRQCFSQYFSKGNPSDCWLWRGCMCGNGYGEFRIAKRQIKAHRAAYILFKGPIPHGLVIAHSCDNPQCVNPGHLTAITQAENQADSSRKGRKCGGYKFDTATRQAIALDGRPNWLVGQQYGCTGENVRLIRRKHELLSLVQPPGGA